MTNWSSNKMVNTQPALELFS